MMLAAWMAILTSALFALGALLTFLLAWSAGQFRDGEETARRMIEERDPAPWGKPGITDEEER